MQSCGLIGRIVSTARSTSSIVAPPVERIIGLPIGGDLAQERRVAEVAGGDLERRDVELGEEVGARLVEGGREERDAELARVRLQLERSRLRTSSSASRCSPYVAPKLFSLSYGAVVHAPACTACRLSRFCSLTASTPHCFAAVKQLDAPSQRALVVVADLGDDVAVASSAIRRAVDDELAHCAIVPLRFAGARADTSGCVPRPRIGWRRWRRSRS